MQKISSYEFPKGILKKKEDAMLDIFKSCRGWYCLIAQVICMINLSIFSISPVYDSIAPIQEITSTEYEWIEQCIHHLNKNASPKEWINFLTKLKNFLDRKGYKSFSLIEMAHFYRNQLDAYGITIDKKDFSYLINLICENQITMNLIIDESNCILLNHSNKQEEFKVSAELVIGFVKCLIGGLLCIIPHPVTEVVAGGLILSGIDECLDEVKKCFN